ncbi:MAG: translation elongation factor 4 [Acidobacteriota bacterium]|nr:translation elongation factor 4 [Acidobacteriota bacterium]
MDPSRIRNFSIIAHIDHGKTTLSDRLLEKTGALGERDRVDQALDTMDLERERGITIKSHAVTLSYTAASGIEYQLNLIDTPGHVDFSYEVSRSLAACEGALLVVDAAQGVEAQTLANAYLAVENDLTIIPVINKIDLPSADPARVTAQIEEVIGLPAEDAIHASAKTGLGIDEILEAIVARIPPPVGGEDAPLKAMVFDSWYDSYRGVTVLVRAIDGRLERRMRVKLMATGNTYHVEEVGVFTPKPKPVERLGVGEVGWVIAGIKEVADVKIGDTLTGADHPTTSPFPGFREIKAIVFAGLYPSDAGDYTALRDALDKLRLNDSSFTFEPETSDALGFGFRAGFLGLLHMEIIQSRLEREFDLDLVTTAPGVPYQVRLTGGGTIEIHSPAKLPKAQEVASIEEPYIRATVLTPQEYVGGLIKLMEERRGTQHVLRYVGPGRVLLEYDLPLAEVVSDFYDRLKSASRGYASYDYELIGWRRSPLVKLDILVNGDPVDALSIIVHHDAAHERGQTLTSRLKKLIPRQQYEVAIQAALGSRVIARTNVKALRKNVIAKCYGGDVTRKRKLLEKQRAGKKRMKQVGSVEVPQEAFLAVLQLDDK